MVGSVELSTLMRLSLVKIGECKQTSNCSGLPLSKMSSDVDDIITHKPTSFLKLSFLTVVSVHCICEVNTSILDENMYQYLYQALRLSIHTRTRLNCLTQSSSIHF